MTDWPRSIKPEDRIKYLINARASFINVEWNTNLAVTDYNEKLWVDKVSGVYMAMYSGDHGSEVLVGEFDLASDARKALIDHVVVTWAIRQAWEDVAI